ncbi:phosphoribosylglycinamide formyltransferase-1 [Flexibacter flexilis DSM 6793]|uniref:Phosphoribosylglycinamide formyltransferase n=1 Tax=Flexibacter flexilis DSM 6793 TaxID=927664 RepID=A0A1I1DQR8_9BACT|nr:phosphoribosylglycinamide formyltransferase [Flexibacter flexilis]SFB75040.1 phosphoribosylglycinamide formyltransferase-1 [Flexibacter flexilis DSM 6793]
MNQSNPKRIAIFCSGSGSNAQKIMEHFQENDFGKVVLLLANTPKAYALERAKALNVETFVFSRTDFYQTDAVLEQLRRVEADVLVLAGFLWLVPSNLIAAFPQRIINIHPALLPKFGGKGMYGHHVHEAVKAAAETESGMTIHLIDQEYDKGQVLFQAKCSIAATDTPEDIGAKVLRLEHAHFAPTIEAYLKQM